MFQRITINQTFPEVRRRIHWTNVSIDIRAFASFESGHTLADLLREDLLAERVVIKIYDDSVSKRFEA